MRTDSSDTVIEIPVARPHEFWFSGRDDGFLDVCPGTDDNRVRRYLDGHADWNIIAAVMSDVTAQLRATPARSDEALVTVPLTLAESRANWEVVTAWFRAGEEVTGDPGNLVNGRHRLWKTWRSRPDGILPIRSDVARFTGEADAEPSEADLERVLDNAARPLFDRNPALRDWFIARRGGHGVHQIE